MSLHCSKPGRLHQARGTRSKPVALLNTQCLELLREALLNSLPVDDLPDGLEVFGLTVLVLEAECNVSFAQWSQLAEW